jgi:hypothetical protein
MVFDLLMKGGKVMILDGYTPFYSPKIFLM